ncbi:MAG: molecular chaperone GroEL [Actinobacteria bacterium]|nr:molecular chaperone GroEL [Actinomycetota bacterium]
MPSGIGHLLPKPERKELRFGRAARETLRQGIDVVANVVGSTLGPRGRNVAFARTLKAPQITNDGVTVANEIAKVNDIYLDLGIQLMKEAAAKTNAMTEDGTTTGTVVAQAVVHRGLYNIAAGANAMLLREGLVKASEAAQQAVRDLARPVATRREVQHVASISSDDAEMGSMIADIMDRIGRDGLIMADIHRHGVRLEKRYVEGMQIDRGWLSPYFITDTNKMQGILENPWVLISDHDLFSAEEIAPILDKVAASGNRNLFFVANIIKDGALQILLQNKLRGNLNVVAIQGPSYGDEMMDLLEDMAVLTGATVISRSLGMKWKDVPLEWLGQCRRVITNREATVMLEGLGREADIQDRQNQIRAQLEQDTNPHWRKKKQQRIARLGGAVGMIMVGGKTEQEMRALFDKAEDAVGAVRVALSEGIVPGGGVSLLRTQPAIQKVIDGLHGDAAVGARVIYDAVEAPMRRIARNAGVNPSVVVNRVKQLGPWWGWDAVDDAYVNMYDAGILDPAAISIASLKAGTSVGMMVLTTEAIVCENRPIAKAKKPSPYDQM